MLKKKKKKPAVEAEKKPENTITKQVKNTVKKTVSKAISKTAVKAINKTAGKPVNKTAGKPANKTVKKPIKKSIKEPITKSVKTTAKKAGENLKSIGGFLLKKMALGGAARLSSKADEVNRLNVFPVPDGDTGDNMRMTIESGIAAIENMDSDDIASVMKAMSHGMLLGARGNSGVILSQFFAGLAVGLEGTDKADAVTMGSALQMGVEQAYKSVMNPAEGTILTVARESVEYAVNRITPQSTIRSLFGDLVKEMYASLERTPDALAVLKEAGVVDSGGAGLFYIMDGFNSVLNGEQFAEGARKKTAEKIIPDQTSNFGPDSKMTYGYCTEVLVQLQNSKTDIDNFDIEEMKSFLSGVGDSIVAFKTESIVKIHIHTFTPEKVIGYCRQFGEFLKVKIENMSVQHTETEWNDDKKEEPEKREEPKREAGKKFGVVAVTNGAGFEALFKELGTDEIVQGGQTKNPSTSDFLAAFEKIRAEHIFVFPNNGNIIMAAQQAAEIYKDAAVHVISSKNLGMGYVALSSADFDSGVEEVMENMTSAMQNVTTGYVAPSIRNTKMNGVSINEGDTIGIIEKEIVVAEPGMQEAARRLASKMLDANDKFMLTVFKGKETKEEESSLLESFLKEKYPSAEVYFVDGGQDVYPFIFVAE